MYTCKAANHFPSAGKPIPYFVNSRLLGAFCSINYTSSFGLPVFAILTESSTLLQEQDVLSLLIADLVCLH